MPCSACAVASMARRYVKPYRPAHRAEVPIKRRNTAAPQTRQGGEPLTKPAGHQLRARRRGAVGDAWQICVHPPSTATAHLPAITSNAPRRRRHMKLRRRGLIMAAGGAFASPACRFSSSTDGVRAETSGARICSWLTKRSSSTLETQMKPSINIEKAGTGALTTWGKIGGVIRHNVGTSARAPLFSGVAKPIGTSVVNGVQTSKARQTRYRPRAHQSRVGDPVNGHSPTIAQQSARANRPCLPKPITDRRAFCRRTETIVCRSHIFLRRRGESRNREMPHRRVRAWQSSKPRIIM